MPVRNCRYADHELQKLALRAVDSTCPAAGSFTKTKQKKNIVGAMVCFRRVIFFQPQHTAV
jgi:hypothetical protein